jgi:hypothetical protein
MWRRWQPVAPSQGRRWWAGLGAVLVNSTLCERLSRARTRSVVRATWDTLGHKRPAERALAPVGRRWAIHPAEMVYLGAIARVPATDAQ